MFEDLMQEAVEVQEKTVHDKSPDMAFEELCRAHLEVMRMIDELTEKKDVLKHQILAAMSTKTATTPCYKVTKVQQILVKTSLECARNLGYTITREQVDKERLRKLHSEGISIPDIEQIEYVKITERT